MARQANPDIPVRLAIGSNPERNRHHNRRVVLEAVRSHGALGRTEIGRLTQLTAQAVANIVDDLVAEHFLIPVGRRRSGRGQPPLQFSINAEGPITIGIELGADRLTTVLLDLTGNVRASSNKLVSALRPEAMAEQVAAEVRLLRDTLGRPAPALGVGVVMPGPFRVADAALVGPGTLPQWLDVDAGELLAIAIGEPVIIENDATAAAVGERLHGAGRSIDDFCFIYFGVGLGLGIIQGGRPMRGAFGNAGEIGLVPTRSRASGELLPLEQIVSLHALRQRLAAAGLATPDVTALAALYAAREPVLMHWIDDAAYCLAQLVLLLENVFDPETIVMGGQLPDEVIKALIAALEPLQPSVASRPDRTQPRVRLGQTGQLTAALGAAALPLFDTVTPRLNLAAVLAATA